MENLTNNKTQTDPNVLGRKSGGADYNNHTFKDYLYLALWIAAVVAVGMFAINQALEFRYKMEFLIAPCKLCVELNPEVSTQCFIKEEKLYPVGFEEWKPVNITGPWAPPFVIDGE